MAVRFNVTFGIVLFSEQPFGLIGVVLYSEWPFGLAILSVLCCLVRSRLV